MRAMRAALALAGVASVTSCAPPDLPVGSPRAPIAPVAFVDVAPVTTTAAPVAPVATAAPSSTAHTGGSVLPGNQHALNGAAVPFAHYLNAMHNRIHGPFSDDALGRLDNLRPNDPLNDMKLVTRLELVIEGKTGKLVRVGVVKTSGLVRFDALALDAVTRAAPFDPAAEALFSSDGNVYIHWEFTRDPVFACSTMHVRPFLLDVGPPPP